VHKAFDIRTIKMDAQKLIIDMINQPKCGGRMHLQCCQSKEIFKKGCSDERKPLKFKLEAIVIEVAKLSCAKHNCTQWSNCK